MQQQETESKIVSAICEYLSYKKNLLFWRQNNLPVFNGDRFYAMPKYSMRGVPDIIVVKDGFFIGIEVKNKKGKQSEHQKEFERKCKEAGGEYYVIKSIEEVKEIGL